jgi:hypothetical protein
MSRFIKQAGLPRPATRRPFGCAQDRRGSRLCLRKQLYIWLWIISRAEKKDKMTSFAVQTIVLRYTFPSDPP